MATTDHCCCNRRSFEKFGFSRLRISPLIVLLVLFMCEIRGAASQRIDRVSCERRPTHTSARKTPGDNGFSIKILGASSGYYEPGRDYTVVLNGSYASQQFLDFMLVAKLKTAKSERDAAGSFASVQDHMTQRDVYCNHIMTSKTFHPSFKKYAARFLWTAPSKGSGCVLFKATVVEHPDIWYSDEGGLTKMFCEEPEPGAPAADSSGPADHRTNSHDKRQSAKCCACDVAKYELTFVGNWSRESHPKDFPQVNNEHLLHWSDIIGASHSPGYTVWRYGMEATTGVKEVCEYGWPRSLEGEIKQQGRNVRTVIKTAGIWGYPALYEMKRSARFSTDNSRPLMSLLTMIGPSPDWCVGVNSLNLCLENCTWLDKIDIELYPWDAGTDSGVTYMSNNQPTFPREKIRPITNEYPNNSASPFYGASKIKPMATVSLRRVGVRPTAEPNRRCEASSGGRDSEEEVDVSPSSGNIKCMVSEWSEYTPCSATCGVGVKTRTRMFKHPMGTRKMCPYVRLRESSSCLGQVNVCDHDPNEPIDVCITTAWSNWSPCTVTCGTGTRLRTRQHINPAAASNCSTALQSDDVCTADIADCSAVRVDWRSVCKLDAEPGTCSGNFTRFFYDMTMKKCRPFAYGGCRGNLNRFDSIAECERHCVAAMLDAGDLVPSAGADRDCMVTEWSAFGPCSVSCGTGQRSRRREIKVRNTGNGAECPKNLYQTAVCASMCPDASDDVDCMMSEWTNWSACSQTCGDGVQVKERMVKRPAQGDGQPCSSDRKEMRQCNLGDCDQLTFSQCMLSEWAPFSECSVACGQGKKTQRRMMKRGPCPDDTVFVNMEPCVGTQCDGVEPRDCVISEWVEWSDCDVPCGAMGSQTRFRMVLEPAINGGLCEFDGPKQMEKRVCYKGPCATPDPLDDKAPVDCQVDTWSPWSACSKTCGTGRQVRRRKIKQKRRNKGSKCGPLKQTQSCQSGFDCPRRRSRRH